MNLGIGAVVGRITVIGPPMTIGGKHVYSLVKCICGKEWRARRDSIRKGRITSCGCQRTESFVVRNTKHGHSKVFAISPTYRSWADMKTRCTNPKDAAYPYYGGRGIMVCDRWNDFNAFLLDMGERPKGKTLERIDNNKGYSPENCRWATHLEQMQNTRRTRHVKFDGQTLSTRAACRAAKIKLSRVYWRVSERGMTHQEAFDAVLKGTNP